MKKLYALLVIISSIQLTQAQSNEWYSTSGWEMPFQFATIEPTPETTDVITTNNIMRWAPALNLNFYTNYDFNNNFGLFSGFTLKNVGFIADFQSLNDSIALYQSASKVRKKYRTYNIGVPIGIKLGNLDGFFFYGGFQIEYAFNYKEKTFVDDKKEERFTVWFGDRAEQFPMSVFAGFQTKYGINLKFQYYLTNFLNKDFESSLDGKLYSGFDANVFYFSLNFAVFRDTDLYFKEYEETGNKD